jgi:cellulose 1,4-beta-cellobiosidase
LGLSAIIATQALRSVAPGSLSRVTRMVVRRPLLAVFLVAASCAHGVDPGAGGDVSPVGSGSSGGASSNGGDLGSGTGNSTSVTAGGSSSSAGGASSGGTTTPSGAGTSSSGGAITSSGGASSGGGTTSSSGATGSGGSPTVVVPAGDLVVQYMSVTSTDKGSIHPHLAVVNRGKKDVPLAQLTLRYWYTADGTASSSDYQQAELDYAAIPRLTNMRTSVVLSTAAVKPPQTGADTYLEVAFMGPDSLGPGQLDVDKMPLVSTQQIEIRVHWPGYTPQYDESNDYSYDATKTSYADSPKVTLYQNGTLIWGVEPDGTKPSGEPVTGGDASAPDAGP